MAFGQGSPAVTAPRRLPRCNFRFVSASYTRYVLAIRPSAGGGNASSARQRKQLREETDGLGVAPQLSCQDS